MLRFYLDTKVYDHIAKGGILERDVKPFNPLWLAEKLRQISVRPTATATRPSAETERRAKSQLVMASGEELICW